METAIHTADDGSPNVGMVDSKALFEDGDTSYNENLEKAVQILTGEIRKTKCGDRIRSSDVTGVEAVHWSS
ncbi:hypothetical protein AUP68_02412 [Ilyonectria robusta]